MPKAAKKQKSPGPVLKPVSEQMREWSAMLQAEVASWSEVSTKKMFGLVSYYRGQKIFAALPYTRTIGSDDSFIFKLDQPSPQVRSRLKSDPHVVADQGHRWIRFCIRSNDDLRGALEWLSLAYDHVVSGREKKRSR